jgi:hypothetical protein
MFVIGLTSVPCNCKLLHSLDELEIPKYVNVHVSVIDNDVNEGIAPCSVELCEARVAVNEVKRPLQFGQERITYRIFRTFRIAGFL